MEGVSENTFSIMRTAWRDTSKPALTFRDNKSITYLDIDQISGVYANTLMALGVKTNDRVVAQVEKSTYALLLYLACLRLGAIYVPINTAYTQHELEYFLKDAEPVIFICRPSDLENCTQLCMQSGVKSCLSMGVDQDGTFHGLTHGHSNTFEDVHRTSNDLAAILYTSGTTGRSKGAMLTHGNLVSNARTLVDLWHFTPDDILVHALPIYHTHGLFVACNVVLMANATLHFLSKFEPQNVIDAFVHSTIFMGVPTYYVRLLNEKSLDNETTKNIRLFISGSAPLLSETFRHFQERTGHTILERYGMTETNMITSNPYDGDRVPSTVGFPLPDVQIRVTDPATGHKRNVDEIGMIEVKGPNVFKGYWRMLERTAEEFREDGFFTTGDLGKIDEQGRLSIIGREKDLVISGGFNVYPKEIESEIDIIPNILESSVIGIAHPDFGEGVLAIVVITCGTLFSEDDVISTLRAKLANYKIPKRIIPVHELPRNAMGKVQKNVLRERYAGIFGT